MERLVVLKVINFQLRQEYPLGNCSLFVNFIRRIIHGWKFMKGNRLFASPHNPDVRKPFHDMYLFKTASSYHPTSNEGNISLILRQILKIISGYVLNSRELFDF